MRGGHHQPPGPNLSEDEALLHEILMRLQAPEQSARRLISTDASLLMAAFLAASTLVGLLGNTAVIIAVAADRTMRRSAVNLLLLNLAVADVFNLLTIVLEWSPAMLLGYPAWAFPALLCPATRYLECAFLFASILTQLMVCVERFIAIVYPIQARSLCTKQKIALMVLLIWISALTFSLPYAISHVKHENSIKCTNPHDRSMLWILYKWFEFMTAYALPCSVMVLLYGKVAYVLWAKNVQLYGSESRSGGEERRESLNVRRGVIKMLVACVLLYFICYSPIQGVFIARAVFGPSSRPSYPVVLLLNALAVTCSACNPILYSLFSRKFRSRIVYLLSCGRHGIFNPRHDTISKVNRVSG